MRYVPRTEARTPAGWISAWALLVSVGAAELPPVSVPEAGPPALSQTNFVREFRFVGNQVFSAAELARVTLPWTGRMLKPLELEEARLAVSAWYINHGYVNSGAVLENAAVVADVVTFRVVEGSLAKISLQGNRWLSESFYRRRLLANGGRPLNVNAVRDTLQLWRDLYPVEQVNADIQPGPARGEALMNLKVKERFPYHLGLTYANNRPPSTGAEQLDADLEVESLTGHGDQLSLDYGVARASGNLMNRSRWLAGRDLAASYALPFTARDTSLRLQYGRNSAAVVEAPFQQLDISSELESYTVALSHPLYRTPTREFSLALSGERRANQTYLLGEPYSILPGAVDGLSVVAVTRLTAQVVDRGPAHVFSARVSLSKGWDALGATAYQGEPHENLIPRDREFVTVLMQAQYLRRLGRSRVEFVARLAGQYSPDSLLALEELAIGGAQSVRGYRENTMARDKGLVATAELRVPLWQGKDSAPKLQWVPFVDVGAGWNNEAGQPSLSSISSAGMGLVFRLRKNLEASRFWGHAFRTLHYSSHNLQDDGIHFHLSMWAF